MQVRPMFDTLWCISLWLICLPLYLWHSLPPLLASPEQTNSTWGRTGTSRFAMRGLLKVGDRRLCAGEVGERPGAVMCSSVRRGRGAPRELEWAEGRRNFPNNILTLKSTYHIHRSLVWIGRRYGRPICKWKDGSAVGTLQARTDACGS
jgi:hypothetical protein